MLMMILMSGLDVEKARMPRKIREMSREGPERAREGQSKRNEAFLILGRVI